MSLWIVVNGPYAIVDDAYDSGRVEEMQHQILISLSADKELYDPLAALVVQQLSLPEDDDDTVGPGNEAYTVIDRARLENAGLTPRATPLPLVTLFEHLVEELCYIKGGSTALLTHIP